MVRPPRLKMPGRPKLPGRRRAINADTSPLAPSGVERSGAEPSGAGPSGGGPTGGEPSGQAQAARARRFPSLWPAVAAASVLGIAALGVLVSTGVIGADREAMTGTVPAGTETVPSDEESLTVTAAAELGFPTFATKNTTRVGGSDPATNAAAVALATFPSSGEGRRPEAVTLVDPESWPAALAAAAFAAEPVSAPILIGAGNRVPEPTAKALDALAPPGGPSTGGSEVITVGEVAMPPELDAVEVVGDSPASTAVEIARTRAELTGELPGAYVVASSTEPGFAMPAASWAARSGDAVLLAGAEQAPEPTIELLRRTPDVPVYVLGPPAVISDRVLEALAEASEAPVRRIAGPSEVETSIAFARYKRGEFGWGINDPGHGLALARAGRPLDAAAAAPLSASGTWAPLLVTDRADELPEALRGYLLDIKPGYRDDPTRALYNHVWIIGDLETIGLAQQASVDQLAELEQIGGAEAPAPGAGGDGGDRDTGGEVRKGEDGEP